MPGVNSYDGLYDDMYEDNWLILIMGGHGGLNILPQKKWNVYNKDNRDIVERDKRIAREKE